MSTIHRESWQIQGFARSSNDTTTTLKPGLSVLVPVYRSAGTLRAEALPVKAAVGEGASGAPAADKGPAEESAL